MRVEASKIVWPTRRETMTTTVMVFIMATIVAIFFFLIDSIIGKGLEFILTIGSWFDCGEIVNPVHLWGQEKNDSSALMRVCI